MNYSDLRVRVRGVILLITGIIVTFIVLSIILDILNVSDSNIITGFIYSVAGFFIYPFVGLISFGSSSIINADAVLALIIYILGGIVIAEIITAFLYEKFYEIFQNVVDAVFKIVELLIFLRIILGVFNAQNVFLPLTKTVLSLTNWTQGIAPAFPVGTAKLDLSALIVLGIIIVLDVISERIIESFFKRITVSKLRLNIRRNKTVTTVKPQAPINQNITINIPVPKEVNPEKKVILVNSSANKIRES